MTLLLGWLPMEHSIDHKCASASVYPAHVDAFQVGP